VEAELHEVANNLVAALVGAVVMYLSVQIRQKIHQHAFGRAVRLFFGTPGKIIIIHSAILDTSDGPPSYNYPATDARAARTLVALFKSVGLREGVDFTVHPDRSDRQLPLDKLWDFNIVLLCGPARNTIFAKVAELLPMRYAMTVGSDGGNALVDRSRRQQLQSSRQRNKPTASPYDYGLVASLPNPNNPSRRLVILAGIHGTGTVGAAEFVSDLSSLRILNDRRSRETISEVVRVDYSNDDLETPTRIELV
jgi:hypothetical protein